MKKYYKLIGGCVIVLFLGALLLTDPPEPEVCALCGSGAGRPYHAPCVVECSTGLIAELAVYDPEPTRMGELAPVQNLDYHVFRAACGGRVALSVDRSPELQRCTAYVPDTDGKLNRGLFCRTCRKLLSGAGGAYALADLYDLEHITVYPMEVGEILQVRDYTVSVSHAEGRYQIAVDAALF